MITRFSDSCGWKLQSLSQAGRQPWERGRRGHTVGDTGGTLLGLSGLLIITCTKQSAACQGSSQLAVGILGEKKSTADRVGLWNLGICPQNVALLSACLPQRLHRGAVQPRQVGSCPVPRGDAKEQLVYYF